MRWNHIRTWMLALGMAAAASFPGLAAENGLDVSNLTWDVDSGSASWSGNWEQTGTVGNGKFRLHLPWVFQKSSSRGSSG